MIPSTVGNLKKLGYFDVSTNKLSGPIPASLGNCKSLYHLTVNDNMLSGHIPQSLADLTNYIYVDFSNNKLVGQIPQGPGFVNQTASAFSGNKGLCGHPLPACKS